MVARVVTVSRMREIDRRPALRRMTYVTFLSRLEMRRRHTDRGGAIVTRCAIASDFLVIEIAAHESRCRMAEVAIQGCSYMILRLTRGRHAMAGLAIIHNTAVIENRAGESASGMAHTAILIGSDMPVTLALGKHAIVARLAVINNPNMIKGRG